MKKIILFFLILFSFIKVYAYENDYFYIDVPSDYRFSNDIQNIYKWDKDNTYYAITITNNKSNYNFKYYTDEEIDNQKHYIEKSINEKLSDYNINSNITSINKVNENELYYLEYNLFLPSKDALGYNVYQKGRVYSTDNYLITIIYNSDKEIKENDKYNEIIKTFKIKDITIEKKLKNYLITAIIIGVTSGVIGYFVSLKKKKH